VEAGKQQEPVVRRDQEPLDAGIVEEPPGCSELLHDATKNIWTGPLLARAVDLFAVHHHEVRARDRRPEAGAIARDDLVELEPRALVAPHALELGFPARVGIFDPELPG